MSRGDKCYLAGPMRGYEKYNFPAFEEATEELRNRGFQVVSPHEMDIEIGFNPATDGWDNDDLVAAVIRDVRAITTVDTLVLLPDWEKSKGARAEKAVAEWLNKPCFQYPCLTLI
jgi:nucleoside 2-deoxyribosyltransferase